MNNLEKLVDINKARQAIRDSNLYKSNPNSARKLVLDIYQIENRLLQEILDTLKQINNWKLI